jgi:cyclohexanecarboxylate-CoA ligase
VQHALGGSGRAGGEHQQAHVVEAGVGIIEGGGCTFSVGATPFLRGLCDEYARRGSASSLTGFVCGGADVPPALVRRAAEVLGAVVVRAYGLTEMPTVTCGGPDDPARIRQDTDGRLTGSSEARLAGPVDGVGELEVRGPELCLGYLDPAHTAESFTADGWFRTGDLATISPGGGITIAGRAKDIIVRGGENISVKEVEDYLLEHPAVGDVAIVGVPDDTLGERACAFVVPAGTAPPPALRELTAFLLGYEIAKHKLPEYLLVTDRLPRTESGKIQKFRLRETAVRELGAGRGERR